MKSFYKRYQKPTSNDLKRHLKAENGDFAILMSQVKILVDHSSKMLPKEMIIMESSTVDVQIILKEKKSRIQSYQGFSKKEMSKLEDK